MRCILRTRWAHPESCRGGRYPQVVQDGLKAIHGLGSPVLADLAEQPVLDGIPLARTGRAVHSRDREAVSVREFALDAVPPRPASWAVAASAVGQDRELIRVGEAVPPFSSASRS